MTAADMDKELYKEKNMPNIRKIRLKLMSIYSIIIIVSVVVIFALVFSKIYKYRNEQIENMISSANSQMKISVDNYMDNIENTCLLFFKDEQMYSYIPSDDGIDEFASIQTEKDINARLMELKLNENFADFGIVYSNNHTVGMISDGTLDMYGDELYSQMNDVIANFYSGDGWSTGYNGDYKKIYYVKKVNRNALLVTSVYSTELTTLFQSKTANGKTETIIADHKNNIIFSSVEGENAGDCVDEGLVSLIESSNSVSAKDDNYFATVSICGDSWRMISSISTEDIETQDRDIYSYLIIVTAVATFIAMVAGSFFSNIIGTKSIAMAQLRANCTGIDTLTRLFDQINAEDRIIDELETSMMGSTYGFLLIDVDNLKEINDNLGHSEGDNVIRQIADVLRTIFDTKCVIGRMGGDKFAVLINVTNFDLFASHNMLKKKCSDVCTEIEKISAGENEAYRVSVSVGVAVYPDSGKTYDELYNNADTALCKAKKKGRNCFAIFNPMDRKKDSKK